MFPAMTGYELALMRSDHAALLRSPESNRVTLQYATYFAPADSPQVDDIYHVDRRPLADQPAELVNVPAIMKIVHERDLRLLAFGILKVGDVLFYFLDDLNLREPVTGQGMVPGTLVILDSTGTQWEPIIDVGPMADYLRMLVQDLGTVQVVAARPKK